MRDPLAKLQAALGGGLVVKAQLKVPVRPSDYPVLNTIEEKLEKEYQQILDRMISDIEDVLGHARGMSKSETTGLYIVEDAPPGWDKGEVLSKALTGKPKIPEQMKWSPSGGQHLGEASHGQYKITQSPHGGHTVSYASHVGPSVHVGEASSHTEARGLAEEHHQKVTTGSPEKRKDIKFPGKRGGKWWRDKQGHVRYGKRPTARFNQEVSKNEALDLSKHVWSVAHAENKEFVYALLDHGFKPKEVDAMMTVGSYVRAYGGDVETAFREAYDWGNTKEADIKTAWQTLQNSISNAMNDPEVGRSLEAASEYHMEFEDAVSSALEESGTLLNGVVKGAMGASTDEGAVKFLAGAIELGLFFFPRHSRDDVDPEDIPHRDRWFGKLYISQKKIDALQERKDTLSPEQLVLLSMAEKFKEAGKYDPALFTGPDGKADRKSFAYADDILSGHEKDVGKLSNKEREKILDKLADIASKSAKIIDDYQHDRGGVALDLLINEKGLSTRAIKDKKGAQLVVKAEQDRQEFIKNSLDAQKKTTLEGVAFSPKLKAGALSGGDKLFHYQKSYINWMNTVKRGINAADTGLGKTPITIAWLDHLMHTKKSERGILVLPPAVMAQWPNEIEKFRPGSKVMVLNQNNVEDRIRLIESLNRGDIEAEFVLMSAGMFKTETGFPESSDFMIESEDGEQVIDQESYDQAVTDHLSTDRFVQSLRGLKGAFVVDEAHTPAAGLKNPSNYKHQIAKEILKDREYAFGLTATPQANEPHDIYQLMELFHPGSAGGDINKFIGKVAVWDEDPKTGQIMITDWKDLGQLGEDIRPFLYARSKLDEDIAYHPTKNPKGIKLPKTENTPHYLSMDDTQQQFYNRASEEVVKAVKELEEAESAGDAGEAVLNALQRISQQRQATIHPKLLDPEYKGRGVKIDWTVSDILNHFSDPKNRDKPYVVFTEFSSAFDILQDELQKAGIHPSQFGRIDKSIPDQEQRAAFQNAVNKGKIKVLMVGMKAGGAGLNLQGAANAMTFLDKPFAPSVIEQAYGRLVRPGSPFAETGEAISANHLHIAGTYDEKVSDLLMQKTLVAKTILNAVKGEDTIKRVTNRAIVDFIGTHLSSEQAEANLPPEIREKVKKEMAKLGVPTDPKRVPGFLKEEFDLTPYTDEVREKSFLNLGKYEIQSKMTLNEMEHKRKEIDKDTYIRRKTRLENDLERWGESVKESRMIPMADWRSDRGTVKTAKNPPAEAVFLTKENPFNAGSEEHKHFELAKKKNLTTADQFVEKLIKPKYGKTWGAHENSERKAATKLYDKFKKFGLVGGAGEGEAVEASPKKAAKQISKQAKTKTAGTPKNPYKGTDKLVYAHFLKHQPKSQDEWAKKIMAEFGADKAEARQVAAEYWNKFKKNKLTKTFVIDWLRA